MNNSSSSEHRIHFDHQAFEVMRGKLDQTEQELREQKDANKDFQEKLSQIEDSVKTEISNLKSTINNQHESIQSMKLLNQELMKSKQELQQNTIIHDSALNNIKNALKELMQFQSHWAANVTHTQKGVIQVQQQLSQFDKSIADISKQKQPQQQLQQVYQPDVEVAAAIEDLQDQSQKFQNQLSEVSRIGNAMSAFFTALYGQEPPQMSVYQGPTLSNSSLNANPEQNYKSKKCKNNSEQQIITQRPAKRQKTVDIGSIFQEIKSWSLSRL
eukprot:TRINITY_DN2697_c1_g1_i2.p1 TRINITY_DN2697_c1_g1~~TRINITY_DN2697_c1_g1_i2.p1  ORF type:complete len:271 (-),score=19.32 TRINITY_DN2697_c1_g1_i2:4-816(-)